MPPSSVELSFSKKGEAALVDEEGEVLKAYRCPAGRWTIGVGLTKYSGVVTPRPGMAITQVESRRLLGLAIERNYAPRVRKALDVSVVANQQSAFDGGVSFDFNTGRIHNASWTRFFNELQFTRARASFMQWVKGGGRVLPGLEKRRRNEAGMIFDGVYPSVVPARSREDSVYASFVVNVDNATRKNVRAELARLGYAVGELDHRILTEAVRAFQRDRDLTPDGLIGRATLSTLQREIDARTKAKATGAGAATGGASAAGGEAVVEAVPGGADGLGLSADLVTIMGAAVLCIALLYGLWLAWSYRDIIATRISRTLPRTAAWLRSF